MVSSYVDFFLFFFFFSSRRRHTRSKRDWSSDVCSSDLTTATPEEFSALASGYRGEIERMQKEVLEYLTRHAGSRVQAKVVQDPKFAPRGHALSCTARDQRVGLLTYTQHPHDLRSPVHFR